MQAVEIASQLIRFPSLSHQANQELVLACEGLLRQLGFQIERVTDDRGGVEKVSLVARRGQGDGGFAFFGHLDVVPAAEWEGPGGDPFTPRIQDNRLFGRGSCDMKGPIACALAAIASIPAESQSRPVYVVLTSDEEVGSEGAEMVALRSDLYRGMAKGGVAAVVGEPTRLRVVHAHKGTCLLRVISQGKAGHSGMAAGRNANLSMIPFLMEMRRLHDETERDPRWHDTRFDPKTLRWNIGINDHTVAVNITPPQSVCTLYFRPMPGMDVTPLVHRVRRAADEHGLRWEMVRQSPAFHIAADDPYVRETLALTDQAEPTTVTYGSDACRLQALSRLVLLGPGDIALAHTSRESIGLDELDAGTRTYRRLIHHWCVAPEPNLRLPMPENCSRLHSKEGVSPGGTCASSYDIRAARPDDVTAIVEFLRPYAAAKQLLARTDEELARLADQGFVAEVANDIVGFAAVEAYSRKMGELQSLAVAEPFRRQGIGHALVRHCIARARELGIYELMAITSSEKLFRECGFEYSLPEQKRALFIRPKEDASRAGASMG